MAIVQATFFIDENSLLKGTQLTDLGSAIGQELDCEWLHSAGIHLDGWEIKGKKETNKGFVKENDGCLENIISNAENKHDSTIFMVTEPLVIERE